MSLYTQQNTKFKKTLTAVLEDLNLFSNRSREEILKQSIDIKLKACANYFNEISDKAIEHLALKEEITRKNLARFKKLDDMSFIKKYMKGTDKDD